MKFKLLLLSVLVCCCSCDRIYGFLHKPGGEEREILGPVVFNEYNPRVEELQRTLRLFGYTLSRCDGKSGASTREAVAKFQEAEDLPVSRFVDKATWARIQEYIQSPLIHKQEINVRSLQVALKKAGFFSGKADGLLGPQTREAVKAFQKANGLTADSLIGLKTIKALLPYLPGTGGKGAAAVAGNAAGEK